jgi:DNA repair protein RadA/Sms
MKLKTVYVCQNCTYQSPKWLGKCPECEAWNSFLEDVVSTETLKKERTQRSLKLPTVTPLSHLPEDAPRLPTGLEELDRVLGGGLVAGSVILLGGEPGIGKSTLTLQLCEKLSQTNKKILYISGEESVQQIALRAKRLNIRSEKLLLVNEGSLESIVAILEQEKPDLAIVDSIQVVTSQDIVGLQGGVTQVRACTEVLMDFAKSSNTPLILIGHVTKEGNLAGPKTLEHLVDTVLTLEGDRLHDMRLLRSTKNRFGSTNEVGIFEMTGDGLREVPDPSKRFIEQRSENTIGSCLTVTVEGNRPVILEIQALTSRTPFGYPKRSAVGFDLNRLQMLIAVLEKHAGLDLREQDVYVNVVGGLKVKDTGIDAAVCMAIVSSFKKIPVPKDKILFGEIGLSGEIRATSQNKKRQEEVKKWSSSPQDTFKNMQDLMRIL